MNLECLWTSRKETLINALKSKTHKFRHRGNY